MQSFQVIMERAAERKRGAEALRKLLPPVPDGNALRAMPDDRLLAEMTKYIFSAGFVWKVIEAKWPGFEAAFDNFDVAYLNFAPDEYWHQLTSDTRIIRNGAKIMSVRTNAHFIRELAEQHGSAGAFLADWPAGDQIGLLDVLSKRGSRLGGLAGQYFLRSVGRDGFILNSDVLACLRTAGVPISGANPSKKELRLIQEAFNSWVAETGLPIAHLSRICGLSIDA
ncbi:DNA-3-methyladenine glycosylase I [Rhizobium sp. BK251]|uniref:DNA-3-methyladenine glycosylase I n=1 Tax=Rhizobium sp. BK251 TaxID=2512125 RepID=UPI00104BFF4A|nr:DNA-3-methyladenine glycosylase I [Rhizobium sp. BK251]TCL75578.1 DNA-3-methyladenine glycosylase I [Rhizobium sp. BK251]